MRYIGLLLLFSFGVFLLFLARSRFESVNLKLSGDLAVQGRLSSVLPDGDLKLKYTVNSVDYEIDRSVPVNLFPRLQTGAPVPLVYHADRPDAATVRHWSVIYQDSAVCGVFGVLALALALSGFVVIRRKQTPPPAALYPSQAGLVSLDRPIELRYTGKSFVTSLLVALSTFGVAYLIYRNPYFFWTPWLGYPAAVAVAVVGLFMLWDAFFSRSLRIAANRDGVAVTDGDGSRKFTWAEVAFLKRETMTQTVRHRHAITNNTSSDYYFTVDEVGHYLILLDKSSKVLLKLDEDTPMDPVMDWLALLAFIPQHTGLPVMPVTTVSPLGLRDGL